MSSDYSHHTIIRYNQAIASIRRLYEDKLHKKYTFPQSLDQDVDEIMTILRENYQQSTLNNFISSILWCLTTYDTSAYDIQYIDTIKHKYRMIGQNIKEQIERDKIGKEFELTDKEKKSFMIWEDVLKVYEKISKNLDKTNYNNLTKEQINVRAEIDGTTTEGNIKYMTGSREQIEANIREWREIRATTAEGIETRIAAREEPVVALGDDTANILDQEFSLSTKLDDVNEIVPELKTMRQILDEENQTNLFINRLADCV